MESNSKAAPVPAISLSELRQCLVSGAKSRIRIELSGVSKAKDHSYVIEHARRLIDRAEVYTENQNAARHFLRAAEQMLAQVLPPAFHKRLRKITCA